jgi:hypothetical protein
MRFEIEGYCPVCESKSTFRAERDDPIDERWYAHWFRGALRCEKCRSAPRERALADTLNRLAPDWRKLALHESSPSGILSTKLARECPGYVETQFDPAGVPGTKPPGKRWRNENLENQTFGDGVFDIVITQDVFEHLFRPGQAAREIARTLKLGGLALMTVPVMLVQGQSRRRSSLIDGKVVHHLPEQYHGNPMGGGSLVTVDWSHDIGAYLSHHSGLPFSSLVIDNMAIGVRDPHNVVLVARKGDLPDLGEGQARR